MRYEWDLQKEKTNLQKHGIAFQQAKEAIQDGIVVVVAYPDEYATRIISARKANKKERKFYEAQL